MINEGQQKMEINVKSIVISHTLLKKLSSQFETNMALSSITRRRKYFYTFFFDDFNLFISKIEPSSLLKRKGMLEYCCIVKKAYPGYYN